MLPAPLSFYTFPKPADTVGGEQWWFSISQKRRLLGNCSPRSTWSAVRSALNAVFGTKRKFLSFESTQSAFRVLLGCIKLHSKSNFCYQPETALPSRTSPFISTFRNAVASLSFADIGGDRFAGTGIHKVILSNLDTSNREQFGAPFTPYHVLYMMRRLNRLLYLQ